MRPLIVRPTDDALFQCPFVMLWQAESLWLSDEDARGIAPVPAQGRLPLVRRLLGHLRVAELRAGNEEGAAGPAVSLRRSSAHTSDVPHRSSICRRVPQIPGISYWWGSGGDTSEQGPDSAEVHVRGIADQYGRLMVLSTHNTDIADGWEREGVDPRYFRQFSIDSYAVGINVMLYTMTH